MAGFPSAPTGHLPPFLDDAVEKELPSVPGAGLLTVWHSPVNSQPRTPIPSLLLELSCSPTASQYVCGFCFNVCTLPLRTDGRPDHGADPFFLACPVPRPPRTPVVSSIGSDPRGGRCTVPVSPPSTPAQEFSYQSLGSNQSTFFPGCSSGALHKNTYPLCGLEQVCLALWFFFWESIRQNNENAGLFWGGAWAIFSCSSSLWPVPGL